MTQNFNFRVVDYFERWTCAPGTFTLVRDNWDDYHFKTTFELRYCTPGGTEVEVGIVKIGEVGLTPETTRPQLPSGPFGRLPENFFSLGQEREYYENLAKLRPQSLLENVLSALNDIAFSPDAFNTAIAEPVTAISLLRAVEQGTVTHQFRRIAQGGEALTAFNFRYEPDAGAGKAELGFEVAPESAPPTNVHAIIGSNGVGKTTLLRNMIKALRGKAPAAGRFVESAADDGAARFVNLVTVAFSAFDPLVGEAVGPELISHSAIGLLKDEDSGALKTRLDIDDEFAESLHSVSLGRKRDRWLAAMAVLCTDPILSDSGLVELLADGQEFDANHATRIFSSLSSGHRIVVLTMTKLVETVEERSLVLIDEPESHLHPPLLSSFTRAISELLTNRNGVAIIATHSPIVLQEVPASCVYIVQRSGGIQKAERPDRETFGENTGILTSTVFDHEVSKAGYSQLLQEALNGASGSHAKTLEHFQGQLGSEARSVLRSLANPSIA